MNNSTQERRMELMKQKFLAVTNALSNSSIDKHVRVNGNGVHSNEGNTQELRITRGSNTVSIFMNAGGFDSEEPPKIEEITVQDKPINNSMMSSTSTHENRPESNSKKHKDKQTSRWVMYIYIIFLFAVVFAFLDTNFVGPKTQKLIQYRKVQCQKKVLESKATETFECLYKAENTLPSWFKRLVQPELAPINDQCQKH